MIKPIPTKSSPASKAIFGWLIALLLFIGTVGVMAKFPAELVGVGEWVRDLVLDTL